MVIRGIIGLIGLLMLSLVWILLLPVCGMVTVYTGIVDRDWLTYEWSGLISTMRHLYECIIEFVRFG